MKSEMAMERWVRFGEVGEKILDKRAEEQQNLVHS